MKLFTHNFLASIQDVTNNYPLEIEATSVEPVEYGFNKEFLLGVLPRLDYSTLRLAAKQTLIDIDLPDFLPTNLDTVDDLLLEKLYKALFGFEVLEGYLICPESKYKYKITRGIPKMMIDV